MRLLLVIAAWVAATDGHLHKGAAKGELQEEWPLWPEGQVPHPAGNGRLEDPNYFTRREVYTWGRFDPSLEPAFPPLLEGFEGEAPPNAVGPQPPGAPPGWQYYYNVTRPLLAPFIVDPASPGRTNASVIILPGGAMQFLAWDEDGPPVAMWLNSLGISAFVLRYRVPHARSADFMEVCNVSGRECNLVGVYDALRALRMVKHRAPALGLDPDKVGCLGFSAGGVLCSIFLDSAVGGSPRVDAADDESFHWGFKMMIYPGVPVPGSVGHGAWKGEDLPQHFIAMAANDPSVKVGDVYAYFRELHQLAPPNSELHIFTRGGHGLANCVAQLAALATSERFVDFCEWVVYAEAFLKNKVLGIWPPFAIDFAKPPERHGYMEPESFYTALPLVACTVMGACLAATTLLGTHICCHKLRQMPP